MQEIRKSKKKKEIKKVGNWKEGNQRKQEKRKEIKNVGNQTMQEIQKKQQIKKSRK